jgi:PAS domain S-box-containing protein
MAAASSKRVIKPSHAVEDHFQSAYHDAPIGIWLVGIDDRLLQVNHAFSRLLGCSAKDLLEIGPFRISHTDDLDIGAMHRRQILATEHKPVSSCDDTFPFAGHPDTTC